MKLNLACGKSKLDGYINVDIDPSVEPDEVVDILKPFYWVDDLFDEVVFFHAIEHIEKIYHEPLFIEIHRVLKENGKFILGYPEFSTCAQYWLDNYLGKRNFWENCIYGRQLNEHDYHVCAMHSPEVKEMLLNLGFKDIAFSAEEANRQYTILKAIKTKPRITYEEHINEAIFK